MIPNNNLSVLPFYESSQYQNARKWWAYGRVYPLFTQAGFVLPFQVITEHVPNSVVQILYLFDANNDSTLTPIADLGPIMKPMITKKEFALLGYDVWVFPGQLPVINSLQDGRYYIRMQIGYGNTIITRVSEIFTVVNNISSYLKITWWDLEDFTMDAGTIVYKNPAFKNILYLCTDIGKPEYIFEEEGETRDGYFFPAKLISEKRYKFSFLASEYLLDVMRFIRMADFAEIEYNGQRYSLDTFLITPEWEDNGDIASVQAEFDTATVAKKIGLGYIKALRGDFNDDFNNDYDNQGGDSGGGGDDGPTYREGQVISSLWVTAGTKFTNASGYAIVVFPVTPGETYSIETDRASSAFAFSSVLPANNVAYIGGARILATPESPQSGTVPAGAAYMGVVYTYNNGGDNIFPSAISLGNDIVRVSDYR